MTVDYKLIDKLAHGLHSASAFRHTTWEELPPTQILAWRKIAREALLPVVREAQADQRKADAQLADTLMVGDRHASWDTIAEHLGAYDEPEAGDQA